MVLPEGGDVAVNEDQHFLSIRLEGKAIGSGRIPVRQLVSLLSEFNKVLSRVGESSDR